MSADLDALALRVAQLETDLTIARYNIKKIMSWIEAHIQASETAESKKTRADRHFLKVKFDD